MTASLINKLGTLGKIAEMKRIYSVIESSLGKSSCFAVTSGLYGEGKTTVCIGLAMAAAEKNKRVLIADYNWHLPALQAYFGIDLDRKSDDFFYGNPISKYTQQTGIENLDILPAVQEHGYEKADFAPELIIKMREAYDVVVIDTSSVFPTNQKMLDPISIANVVDGVVMVVLTNITPRQELKKASVALETAGANIIGVVANHWQNPI